MQTKPHKGQIKDWFKRPFNLELGKTQYPDEDLGLGFVIGGTFLNHPQFGYSPGGRTSWIVAMSEPDADGNVEVETRNSRYTLVGPAKCADVGTPSVKEQTGKLAE